MDVARFGEDNPTSEATNPAYPYAWRYRDWIIDAVNRDVPYDRFVKLQLAADLMPGTPRDDLRALGYLGAAPIYHKDQRLSADVIGGFMTDDWDERVDAVSRGLLALTVSCARCHDHKFDPITTKDYYGLVGVFASTMRVERPMLDVDPKVEQRYLWAQNRLFDLRYAANLLTGEASTVVGSEARVAKWKAEIEALKTEMTATLEQYPLLVKSLEKFWTQPQRRPPPPPPVPAPDAAAGVKAPQPPPVRRGRVTTSNEPFMNAVYDAAQYVDGSDAQFTWLVYKPGEARDFPVLPHGNVATPGEIVPRHFPTVLAKGDGLLKNGSGRLELAEKIFTDAAPLAARVMVNRVWGWHFGRPLVATPSDYGAQGEKPTHPELLDDLAARFIAHGWSLKWLNREIMMSAAYRQSSRPRADAEKVDQVNSLLWRMNPRRLDVESYRDTLLRSAGRLSDKMYGPSEDAEAETSVRRTVYARVSRGRLSNLLKVYDFPDPVQTSGGRDLTTTSLTAAFHYEQPLHARRGGGAGRGRRQRARRQGEDACAVSQGAIARPEREGDGSGARLSGARNDGAVRAGAALQQRGDFLAMIENLSRRRMIQSVFGGVGAVGLSSLLSTPALSAAQPQGRYSGTRTPGKAKHVISLFLSGGPSHVDMFDPKPALVKYQGQRPGSTDLRTERQTGGLMPSPFAFQKYGQSGIDCSEIMKNMASVIDDVCVLRSMYSFNPTHTPALGLYHTGTILLNRPSLGSWISYGLGTENQNLPAFVASGFGRRRCGWTRRFRHALRLPARRTSGHVLQRFRDCTGEDDPEPAKQVDGRQNPAPPIGRVAGSESRIQ